MWSCPQILEDSPQDKMGNAHGLEKRAEELS